MNNIEMVKLAAKAAGLRAYYFPPTSFDSIDSLRLADGTVWNPLVDDGDAFRLMVRLRLWRDDETVGCHVEDAAEHRGDENAATRKAIVRAAAEIGQRML